MTTTTKRFPSCTLYYMAQRSPEWYAVRKGAITASKAGEWLAEQPECRMTIAQIQEALDEENIEYKKSAKRDDLLALLPEQRRHLSLTQATLDAQKTAIYKILGQQSTVQQPYEFTVDINGDPPSNPALWAIWNGLVLEDEAAACFEFETGYKLEKVGFARHNQWAAGCSPDGLLMDENIGYENKAPLPHTHLKYLFQQQLPDDYKVQVHFSMAVTGADAWWFQSYCPGLPTFRILVARDDYTKKVENGLANFTENLEDARQMLEAFN